VKFIALIFPLSFFLLDSAYCAQGASSESVALQACAALATRVDAYPGSGPVFLRSYDDVPSSDKASEPALRTAAFTYDNALAVIALIACADRAQALRVGEALRLAATAHTRLRNAYRAGAVSDKVLPNGWWDAKQNRWIEDASQDGTATGNVAWAALAMLALDDATGDTRWREAAQGLATWVVDNTKDSRGAGGFSGGVYGFDDKPQKVLWKATEHNIDLLAVFERLAGNRVADDWAKLAVVARHFLLAQWDSASGHFVIGTLPDGVTPNRGTSALDVQLWALLLPNAPHEWQRALNYAEREHHVSGGFDFNADRDGLWLEGTAQAALVYRLLGREHDAQELFATIAAQFSAGGLLYATREARITTGLAISNDSTSADFYYYRRPHVGATAWAALAARSWNPFVVRESRKG
jgi:hypothetical protein